MQVDEFAEGTLKLATALVLFSIGVTSACGAIFVVVELVRFLR